MRLWHQDLISRLPMMQLKGQHRECCALRGNGWGKKHATVDYVFTYPMDYLVAYHVLIMAERIHRGLYVNPIWLNVNYRGQYCNPSPSIKVSKVKELVDTKIYAEHNDAYLQECLQNLDNKGAVLWTK